MTSKHTTVNYVDNSTSTISSKTTSELQTHLNHSYMLLESYYNINYLKINPNKTKIYHNMQSITMLSYHQIVVHESIKLMHRISYESQPPALSQPVYHSLVRLDIDRQVRKPSVKYKSLSAKNIQ